MTRYVPQPISSAGGISLRHLAFRLCALCEERTFLRLLLFLFQENRIPYPGKGVEDGRAFAAVF